MQVTSVYEELKPKGKVDKDKLIELTSELLLESFSNQFKVELIKKL
jgi:hypothetical protein